MSEPAVAPPGRIRYAVALAIFFIGMAGMATFLVNRLSSFGDNLVQIVVPGERDLPLAAGRYTIFHERQSVIDGRIFDSAGLGGLEVSVQAPDGAAVPLESGSVSGQYNLGARSGFAAFEFVADRPGSYRLAGRYADGASEPQTVLAVGQGFLAGLLKIIFGGLAFAFGGAILATALAVATLIKRRRAGFRF
jgi:hypothetical protein